jgi:hypothetical protein
LRDRYRYTPQNLSDLRTEHGVTDTYPSLDTLAKRAANKTRHVSKALKTGDGHRGALDSYIRLAFLYLSVESNQAEPNRETRLEAYVKTVRGVEANFRDRYRYDAEDIQELREAWILSRTLPSLLE